MEKNTVKRFMEEGRPVWLLGTWSEIPLKARIVKISDSEDGCVEVDYIHDGECIIHSSEGILFEDLFETKEDITAAMFETVRQKIVEIKSSIQTKEDCIQFLFNHNVSCGSEPDWAARRAVREITRERWGMDLELEAADGRASVSKTERQEEMVYNKVSENLIEIALTYASLWAGNEKICGAGIDSISWKQMFVQWANDFETEWAGTEWDQNDYLEEIQKFAQKKILEYAGMV